MRTGGSVSGAQRIDARGGVARAVVYAAATVAPHALTTRSTYTVPAASKALVENASAAEVVDAAVTTAGVTLVRVRITPDSGGAHAVLTLVAPVGLPIGSGDSRVSVLGVTLNAGDVVDIQTEDGATGGTKRYDVGVDLYEFTS